MASRPRRIPAAEWDSHKDTILNLRQSGVSIKGEDGIVTRMERDYEFEATPAQYELQLSKWGARKNINADEWRRTLQVLDQYNEDKIKCAVYRNGDLVSPLILRKKRNQHCKGHEYARLRRTRVSVAVLPECIEIKTSESQTGVTGMLDVDGDEDRDEDGDENTLSSGPYNLVVTTNETMPVVMESHVGAVGGFGMGESCIGSQMPVPNPFLEQPNQTMGAMSALANKNQEVEPSTFNAFSEYLSDAPPLAMDHVPMDHNTTLDMVSLVRDNPATRRTSLIGPDIPLNAEFDQDLEVWWNSNMQSPSFNENLETRGYQSLGASLELPTQQAVVHRHSKSPGSRGAGDPGGSNARQIITDLRPLGSRCSPLNSDDALLAVETIGLRLSSSIVSDAVSSNYLLKSRTAAWHRTFNFSSYGSLILSVENNFAGLDGMPIGALLKFLEQGPQMRSQLSKYLWALPNNISETVAKNLIRAAIENCDSPMVTELLKTGLVAPNDIVCSVDGGRYTAVERSAMLDSVEITKILLLAGADINKTYRRNADLWQGALELAIHKWGSDSPVDRQLVIMLLNHGAKVRVWHAAVAVHLQDPVLIKAIMSGISPYDHPDAFRRNGPQDAYSMEGPVYSDDFLVPRIMQDAVRLLDGELSTSIIEQLVTACYQTNCGNCSEAYPESLQESMTLAAMRGHSKLVAFLVDHVADKGPPLAGAVRSGQKDIIDLLLEKGANPDAPECFIGDDDDDDDEFFTTPFAEAIRAKDDELIQRFHGLGATTHISEKGRFEAAIYAASEAGNLSYLNEFLQMAPFMDKKTLNPALCISIRKGYQEVATTLLKAGADVNMRWAKGAVSANSALAEALDQKNKTLVHMIMECDVNLELHSLTFRGRFYPSFLTKKEIPVPMVAAARWGDISILKDLLSMSADINAYDSAIGESPITIAVRSKNRPLVEFFVEKGARLDAPVSSEQNSPLMAAISNEDLEMMQYLLVSGADPSCSKAIKKAVQKGREVLAVILDAIRIKIPRSQEGLGAGTLLFAIEKDDVELIDILLEAKFDVNAIVGTGKRKTGCISALGAAIEKSSGSNLDTTRKLISAGGDPNSVVWVGGIYGDTVWPRRTALLQAILTKSKPLVELLIDKGADIKRAARLGVKRTPLQQACEVGAIEVVDLFLEKEVDVNEAPALRGGATSLQLCAIKGYCGLAEKLLKLDADVHAHPSEVNGRTALDGAAENGRLDMLMLLWNATADKRFTSEQCSHAMKLAEENGHTACCDLIRQLDVTSRPFLEHGRLSN